MSAALPLPCGCGREASLAALPARLGTTFVLERRLGAGGMGLVYLARDIRLDREVALKTLPRLRPPHASHLRREARAMARLNHPGLATIHGLRFWRGTPVLVVEYFPFGTLADVLASGPLPANDVIRIGRGLAMALDYMHARSVLHRDLKPANVALTAEGLPVLLDFGLASLTWWDDDDELHAGTRGYVPPEAGTAAVSTAVDLWALAVIILEALVGRSARTEQIANRIDLTMVQAIAPRFVPFFARALAEDPAHRFQTAAQIDAALAALTDPPAPR